MFKFKTNCVLSFAAAVAVAFLSSCAPVSTATSNSNAALSSRSGDSKSAYYGTYNGNWIVNETAFPMSVVVSEDILYCESSMMTLTYEHVWWTKDSEGNYVCNGNHITDSTNAKYSSAATTVTVKTKDGSKTAVFSVVAMAAIAAPAEITYASSSIELPPAYAVCKTYTEDASGAIKAANFASDMAPINASDNQNLSVVIVNNSAKVKITVPSISGDMLGTQTTIPGFTIDSVDVAKTSSGYTLSIGTYTEGSVDSVSSSTAVIATITGKVDGADKTWKVYGLEGTVVNGKLNLKVDYTYGAMPFHSRVTFVPHN